MAVESQEVATNDIVSNMTQAAIEAKAATENVISLKGATAKTAESSQKVSRSANELTQQAEKLKIEISSFIDDIQES